MMIRLELASRRQLTFAEILWNCSTERQVMAFRAGLPTQEMRQEVDVIINMMIMAAVDDATANPDSDDLTAARDVIDRIRSR